MKHFKRIIFIMLLFITLGCGARLDYNVNVDTNSESIKLDIIMNIEEADYEHIQGGRKKLISIIDDSIPEYMKYSIDESKPNEFLFTIDFKSYDDYRDTYKKVAGVDSKSVFEEPSGSKNAPFHLRQHIEMKDDLTVFLNWLKTDLSNIDVISKEDQSNLISSENFVYSFNGESTISSDEAMFDDETEIQLKDIRIHTVVKEGKTLDFSLSFLINEKSEKQFADNFNGYLKSKQLRYESKVETVKKNKDTYICRTLELKNLNLNDEKDLSKLNKLFGTDFSEITYMYEDFSNLFKEKAKQNIMIDLDLENLFQLQQNKDVEVTLELNGTALDQDNELNNDLKMPYKTKIQNNDNFHISLHTVVESYRMIPIISVISITLIILFILYKYITRHGIKKVIEMENIRSIKQMIQKLYFIEEVYVRNEIIEGKQFFIKIKNISKIDVGNKIRMTVFKPCLFLWIAFVILLEVNQIGFSIVTCFIAGGMTVLNIILYQTPTIEIELSSGKNYYMSIYEKEKTMNLYYDLLKKVERNRNKDMIVNKIKEHLSEGKEYE